MSMLTVVHVMIRKISGGHCRNMHACNTIQNNEVLTMHMHV